MQLSSILNQLPKAYSTPELNIDVKDEKKFKLVKDFVRKHNLRVALN